MSSDRVVELEELVGRLREELWRQWDWNHYEHCGDPWQHPGRDCYWPLPEVLRIMSSRWQGAWRLAGPWVWEREWSNGTDRGVVRMHAGSERPPGWAKAQRYRGATARPMHGVSGEIVLYEGNNR